MNLAFLMDPLESVKAYKDTSYYLMLAAYQRGHKVFYFNQNSMQVIDGVVSAHVQSVAVHDSPEHPFSVLTEERAVLSGMNAIVVRTDPPVDRSYLYATLLLDLIGGTTVIVNRPEGIRNWNEKLAALCYPDISPATLVTRSKEEILRFEASRGRLTLKPVDGHGGEGIVFYGSGDDESMIDQITSNGRHWVIAQEYLSAAAHGDKRIHLLDGEPVGAILRVHAEGRELNNLDQGGVAVRSELDEVDHAICRRIRQGLSDQGIFYAGIDVIGGKLIEINVTSPTGLQELCRFDEKAYHHDIVEALECKVSAAAR